MKRLRLAWRLSRPGLLAVSVGGLCAACASVPDPGQGDRLYRSEIRRFGYASVYPTTSAPHRVGDHYRWVGSPQFQRVICPLVLDGTSEDGAMDKLIVRGPSALRFVPRAVLRDTVFKRQLAIAADQQLTLTMRGVTASGLPVRGVANPRVIQAKVQSPECQTNEMGRPRGVSYVVLRNLRVKSLEFEFSQNSTRRVDWSAVIGGVVVKANAAIFSESARRVVVQPGSGEDWIVGLSVARVLSIDNKTPHLSLQVKQLGPSFNPRQPAL